jgi:hypothetical protein
MLYGPGSKSFSPVTPADDTDLGGGHGTRALYVAGAGNVCVLDMQSNEKVIAVAANAFLPICVKRVKATLTTATGILAIFDS